MRTVNCDFCHVELVEKAWDCPALDFDYEQRRTGLGPDAEPVDGSIGSWIACLDCAYCVTNGRREELLTRALIGNFGLKPIPEEWTADLRRFLDRFWEHRNGAPVEIGADQLALIAQDPTRIWEPRP